MILVEAAKVQVGEKLIIKRTREVCTVTKASYQPKTWGYGQAYMRFELEGKDGYYTHREVKRE